MLAARASIVLSVLVAILYLIDGWELRGLALALYIYGGVPFPYLLVRVFKMGTSMPTAVATAGWPTVSGWADTWQVP